MKNAIYSIGPSCKYQGKEPGSAGFTPPCNNPAEKFYLKNGLPVARCKEHPIPFSISSKTGIREIDQATYEVALVMES